MLIKYVLYSLFIQNSIFAFEDLSYLFLELEYWINSLTYHMQVLKIHYIDNSMSDCISYRKNETFIGRSPIYPSSLILQSREEGTVNCLQW